MKIPITETTIQSLATKFAEAAVTIVRKQVAQLDEVELIRDVNERHRDHKERVLDYLNRRQLDVRREGANEIVSVANSYLSENLRLHIPALKMVRETLEAAGTIHVSTGEDRTMHWYYRRSAPPATTTGTATKQ